jgi:hypothetical protein
MDVAVARQFHARAEISKDDAVENEPPLRLAQQVDIKPQSSRSFSRGTAAI